MQEVAQPVAELDPISEFVKRAKPQDGRAVAEWVGNVTFRFLLPLLLFSWKPEPLTFWLLFFMSSSTMGILLNLSHEAQHSALLRNKKWNDWVGAWLCAYPAGSIFGASRAVHLAHHKYLNTSVDPDRHFHIEEDKSTPGQFILYYSKLVMGGQLWTSLVVNGLLRPKDNDPDSQTASVVLMPQRDYPEIYNVMVVQALMFGMFWLVTGYWWAYLALWFLPITTVGTALGFIRGFIDHARLADDDPEKSEGRLFSVPHPSLIDHVFFTVLDFEHHGEHHLFPSVPHFYLPRLHKLLQKSPEFSSKYLLRPSYTSFLAEYWNQICSGRKSPDTTRTIDEVKPEGKRKPKVLFIQPQIPPSLWTLEDSGKYAGCKYANPPLGIMTLAGAITPDYQVEIRDENVGPVQYDTDADIVGLSAGLLNTHHLDRVYALAKYFREKGKLICIGGPVANTAPELVRAHCDVVFEGEGELTWPQFLKDYEEGNYKDGYQQIEKFDMSLAPIPRVDLINVRDYSAGQVQTTRGCPFTCEFCDIIVVFGRKVRTKSIENILKEVQLWSDAGHNLIFFSDDNFVGNRVHAKNLLRALVTFNASREHPMFFYTQASIDTAKDPELMELLRDANFTGIFIGIESPRKESLTETLKVQNVHTEDMAEAIHTIQSYGLWVSGGMIVGFDNDDSKIFDEQYEFLQRAAVVFCQVTLLEAMPATPLYKRMKENGRLIEYRHNLPTNIMPAKMSYDELVTGYRQLIRRLYTYEAYTERFLNGLSNMKGYKFANDNRTANPRQVAGLLSLLGFYLLTTEIPRIKFFFNMLLGTMRINPRGWKYTFRYLCSFVHFHKYAYENGMVILSPVLPEPAGTSEVQAARAG